MVVSVARIARARQAGKVSKRVHFFVIGACVVLAACSGGGGSAGKAGSKPAGSAGAPGVAMPEASVPFQADPPTVYVAKVKNLLVGLPPTDDEVTAVVKDPSALGGLVDQWIALPEYATKMQTFFELAFQQTQITITDLADQAYPRQADPNTGFRDLLAQNAEESFSRTVLELVSEGLPFTNAITTQRFMMTPALMELYAFFDAWQVNDDGTVNDAFKQANPRVSITVEAQQGPIAIADSLNPSSANFMHFYDPDVGGSALAALGCGQDPIVYPARGDALHYLLMGTLVGFKSTAGTTCLQFGGSANAGQLTADDFDTWKMVNVRAPMAGEATTKFYDLPTLRTSDELVLNLPRVGFFTTPAFFANWQTNISNQMRVTINQALIVAIGADVDGTDPTIPTSTPGLDEAHASAGDCLGCHQTLDPTRSILASTYSWNYHAQDTASYANQKGVFVFRGVQKPVASVMDLAATLASHPLFAPAWVEKLCYYANSSACDPADPEFQRVVSVFVKSGYSWNALVHELMASPLTTNASETMTTRETGGVVAVSRRDHLCTALDARFGFADVCGLNVLTRAAQKDPVPEIVAGLPSDGYGRGAVAPVLPNEPTLFYRAGLENICEVVSARVIDPSSTVTAPATKTWSSSDPDGAIADFVATVMALVPSDPRSAPAVTILRQHFTSATMTGASPTVALRSTFVAACLAPSSVSIGM